MAHAQLLTPVLVHAVGPGEAFAEVFEEHHPRFNRGDAPAVEPFFQTILDGFLHPDAEILSLEQVTPQTA